MLLLFSIQNLGGGGGPPITTATMPDLVGDNYSDALTNMLNIGLDLIPIVDAVREYSPTIPIGYIISQEFAAGSQVTLGTIVDVVVSNGVDPNLPLALITVPLDRTTIIGRENRTVVC